jgi:F0F1-type ATP synthase assembly protein I
MVWSIIGTLVAGVLAWGGIGWLLDRWLGTGFLVAVGILLGMAGAFYLIIKRYGSS